MRLDDARLGGLIEHSQDIHSDAMHATRTALEAVVAEGRDARANGEMDAERRRFVWRALFAAGAVGAGFGATFLRGAITQVFAAGTDVDALQTSAAIENLAVAVYMKAAGLPPNVSGASNPVVLKFVQTTISQHTDHANAFNAAIAQLGGKKQTDLDTPVYNAVVTPALPKITGPADALSLAITLEDAAAQSYVKFAGDADDAKGLHRAGRGAARCRAHGGEGADRGRRPAAGGDPHQCRGVARSCGKCGLSQQFRTDDQCPSQQRSDGQLGAQIQCRSTPLKWRSPKASSPG